jgi:putative transposase
MFEFLVPRRLDGHNQLPKVVLGVKFTDGIEIRSQAQDGSPSAGGG